MAKTSTPPGDGKNTPFVTSPGAGGGAGKFDLATGRGAPAAGKAPPFDQYAQVVPTDGGGSMHDVAAAQTPPGGSLLLADPGNGSSAADVGTGTQGKNKSGFRLTG